MLLEWCKIFYISTLIAIVISAVKVLLFVKFLKNATASLDSMQ